MFLWMRNWNSNSLSWRRMSSTRQWWTSAESYRVTRWKR